MKCKNGGKCEIKNKEAVCICTDNYTGKLCENEKCSSVRCQNNGKCVIKNGKPACDCPDKYTGDFCEKDKCSILKCKFGGSCIIKNKEAICNCTEKYTGENCEKDKCSLLTCKNRGKCAIKDGNAVCVCSERYTGKNCEIEKCNLLKCKNSGKCTIKNGDALCVCTEEYTGNNCEIEKCSLLKCENHGECKIKAGNAVCVCALGYTGTKCEIEKCSLLKCQNKGKCAIKYGHAVCVCTEGYTGENCEIDKCSSIKCQNGGNCVIDSGNAVCKCSDRYTGSSCETDKCLNIKCQNGGSCVIESGKAVCNCTDRYTGKSCEKDKCLLIKCQNGGKCDIKNKNAACICTANYTGEFCDQHKCSMINCQNGGKCEMKNGNATCNCTDRYTGDYCETDKCLKKCKNGGTCYIRNGKAVCSCLDAYVGENCEKKCNCKNGTCNIVSGKVECICNLEFGLYDDGVCKACECGKGANCTFEHGFFRTTKTCLCPKGFKLVKDVCVDPDTHNPCKSSPCKNGASCEKDGINAKCICLPGYNGKLCEKDICNPNPCKNKGTCQRDTGKPVCVCKDAFTGDKCEKEKCSFISCKNGGKCKIENENPVCDCPDNYTGDTCETDKCSLINCQYGGKCEVKNKVATCLCPERRTGKLCEIDKCSAIDCKNNGLCIIDNGTAECACTARYTGDSCEIDRCSLLNCKNGGKCSIRKLDVFCRCTDRFTGDNCEKDKCTSLNCENGGTCHILNGTAVCNCTDKFTGNRCEIMISTPPSTTTTTTSPIASTTVETMISTPRSTTSTTTSPTTSTTVETNSSEKATTGTRVETPATMSTSPSPASTTAVSTTAATAASTTIITFSTMESSDYIMLNSTTDLAASTTKSVKITTGTTSKDETIATPSVDNVCKKNFCKNGGTCIKDNGEEKCLCPYPYAGKTCEDDYWCTGVGKELCNGQNCTFDYNTRIGRCVCPNGQFYDYNKRMCQDVDKCPLMPRKCTRANEECKNNKCDCKENYRKNNKNECVPNFCEKFAKTVCKPNTDCRENARDPENVICQCKSGYVFNGTDCVKVNKCYLPGILGCQQICEPETETCSCFPGYELQEDNKSCKLRNETDKCSKDCKPGICSKVGEVENCSCPVMYVNKNGACKDLCTAGNLPSNFCPGDLCEPHSDLGFRCKCSGKWTYDDNKVTCRRKVMCNEEGGIEICTNKSAKCVEDDKLDFKCVCAETEEMDEDGICKNKCELKKYQDSCRAKLAECDMQGSEVKCKCPTLLTFNNDGVCTELAASFSGELPFYKDIYAPKALYSPGRNASELNYQKMKQDLRDAMHLIYGSNYRFADIKSCKDTNDSLICSVEIQFNSEPRDQYKLLGSSETCIPGDSNTCLIPPHLVLEKKAVNANLLSQTDPCTERIKQLNCGLNETLCRNTTSDKRNYECICAEGFESYSTAYPVSDRRTVIHKCQDINECLSPESCPKSTSCKNTHGSYDCLCNEGDRPVNASLGTKASGCVAICGPHICGNGDCEINGIYYTCRCKDDYSGPDCTHKIERTEESKGAQVGLIILSTLVVPLALFAAFMIHKYKLLSKKLQKANFLDDTSSTISMEPMRNG